MSRRAHVWVPDFGASRGGIGAFSEALARAVAQAGFCVSVWVKHRAATGKSNQHRLNIHQAGMFPQALRTAAFAAWLLSSGGLIRPRMIICTHVNFAVVARLLKRWRGVPYWVVAHGIEAWGELSPARRVALVSADKILAVSRYTRDRLIADHGVEPQKVTLLPNTVDCDRFKPGPRRADLMCRHGIPIDAKVILTVGRLARVEQYKGYDRVIEAMPRILESIPHAHYILVGKGDDLPRVQRLVADLGLSSRVTFAGFVPDDELPAYYNLCDVFAMPSTGEGFGIVFLEALACGKPVLAGNRDGSVDAVLDGELGLLVDPESVEKIAAGITDILSENGLCRVPRDGGYLRKRVVGEFGPCAFSQRVGSLLSESGFLDVA